MNKLALVSGAAGGLGKAMTTECAARGYDLYITDISAIKLACLATGIKRQYGVEVYYKACDLTDTEAIIALWEDVAHHGELSLLVNVAGLDFEGAFMDVDASKLNTIVRVNIEATITMTQEAVKRHVAGERMNIINVCSLAAYYPMPVKAVYAASKRFLLNFTLALREELKERNIIVTALCPAGMPTTQEAIDSIASQGLAGAITTYNTTTVAHRTISRALSGRRVYVPGIFNSVLRFFSVILPPPVLAHFIYKRWCVTRDKVEAAHVNCN